MPYLLRNFLLSVSIKDVTGGMLPVFASPVRTSALRLYRGLHLKPLPVSQDLDFEGFSATPLPLSHKYSGWAPQTRRGAHPKPHQHIQALKWTQVQTLFSIWITTQSLITWVFLGMTRNRKKGRKKKRRRSEIHLLSPQLWIFCSALLLIPREQMLPYSAETQRVKQYFSSFIWYFISHCQT